MASKFAKAAIPEDDQRLVNEIEEVQEWLTQVEEEMERFYELAPKVKRYFELYHQELLENRRSPKYVEDVLTGDEVVESHLVRRSFRKFDTQIYGDVAKFNYPLNHFRTRLDLLRFEATKRGISLPRSIQGETAFRAGDDYRCVWKDGQEFTLTTSQAAVIRCLHAHHENKTPDVSQEYLLDRAGVSSRRIAHVFKNNMTAWKTLVATGDRKGIYRLNI